MSGMAILLNNAFDLPRTIEDSLAQDGLILQDSMTWWTLQESNSSGWTHIGIAPLFLLYDGQRNGVIQHGRENVEKWDAHDHGAE